MKVKKITGMAFIILLVISELLFACTRVFWNTKGALVVGRTFDWGRYYHETLDILPRGLPHQGQITGHEARWTSKYGSVVVVEHHKGQEAVTDGVNEQGLAAHLLSFDDALYEKRDETRPGVANLQWIQYYLDNFSTIDELISHINDVQIVPEHFARFRAVPLHVAMEDATGDSIIIEFIKGKLVIFHDRRYALMTNDPVYSEHLNNWETYEQQGCPHTKIPLNDSSKSRFVRASCYLRALPVPENPDEALGMIASIIENASLPYGFSPVEATWWQSLIDFQRKRYYFKSAPGHNLFWVDFAKIDFGQPQVLRRINAHSAHLAGDITDVCIENNGLGSPN